jgi:ribosomal protein S7
LSSLAFTLVPASKQKTCQVVKQAIDEMAIGVDSNSSVLLDIMIRNVTPRIMIRTVRAE